MPHRADHPTTPHSILLRGRGLHPPPPSLSGAYQMHPAEVAAVAAHRARFFAAGLPQTYGTMHHVADSRIAQAAAHRGDQPLPRPRPSQKREAKEESPEEAAASALLLAASGESPIVSSTEAGSKNPPLKKRKKHLDFLRRNTDGKTGVATSASASSDSSRLPCHVSPVSSSSVGTHSTAEETASTPKYATPASRSSSYDLKDGHPLNHEDRMKDSMDIVMVKKDFPAVLHDVLNQSGTVLQWLEHGRAWRVLRWDALRCEVLPKHFGQLDSSKSGGGSIDSFLSHLKDWGFEEIKDGPDVGAYSHPLFLRGDPSLCQQMHSSSPSDSPQKMDVPASAKSSSPSPYESPQQLNDASSQARAMRQPHSILQVPSLRSDVSEKGKEHKEHVSPPSSALKRNTSYPPDPSVWGRHHLDPRQYRNDIARQYPDAASPMTAAGRTWFPFGSHEQQQHHPPLPRVRSTRGGSRAGGVVHKRSESRELKKVSSFPVSQRGKGRRVGAHAPIRTSTSHDGNVRASVEITAVSTKERNVSAKGGAAVADKRATLTAETKSA